MQPKIAILMGSDSDAQALKGCGEVLREFKVGYAVKVLSAHRTPAEVAAFVKSAKEKGFKVLIGAAGGAAHLAGVAAAYTTLPVIGIPLSISPFNGLDSFLSTLQMPAGTPVATVALGPAGVRNAAFLALRILALEDSKLAKALESYKKQVKASILKKKVIL